MRWHFVTALSLFVLVHAALTIFSIDRWPLTNYPMYSTLARARFEVFHLEPSAQDIHEFGGSRMNWALNGPPRNPPFSPFEKEFLSRLVTYACPPPGPCRLLRTRISRKENGAFAFETTEFHP